MADIQRNPYTELTPHARKAFDQAHLSWLATYLGRRTLINDFSHRNCISQVDDGGGVPHRLSAQAFNGSVDHALVMEVRTAAPYIGIPTAKFTAPSVNDQGAQWNDGEQGVMANGYLIYNSNQQGTPKRFEFPLDVWWCCELAVIDPPAQGTCFVGINDFNRVVWRAPPITINDIQGCGGMGFFISGVAVFAVYANHEVSLEVRRLPFLMTQGQPVRFALNYKLDGFRRSRQFADNQFMVPTDASWIQFFINGDLVYQADNAIINGIGGGLNNYIISENQTSCFAIGRRTGAYNVSVPYWGLSYTGPNSVFPYKEVP